MLTLTEIEEFISTRIDGFKPPVAQLEYYRRAVGADKPACHITNPAVKGMFRDAIIFVSDRPTYFFLRMSISLRKKGARTVLLSRWGVEQTHASFFDHVVLYDKILDLRNLASCVDCLIYVQAWVGWHFLPTYVRLITDQTVACNMNDLASMLFDDQQHLSLIGLSTDEIEMDLSCEDDILQRFPLVTVLYNLNCLDGIRSGLTGRSNIRYFPCYPSPCFYSESEGRALVDPMHLVYIGRIPADHSSDEVFRPAKMRDIVDDLLKGPFRLTILNEPRQSMSGESLKDQYPHFAGLAESDKRFQFRDGWPPWGLKHHTKEFHYGLMLHSFDRTSVSKLHYQTIVPTKLFTYMELGLPVIVIDETLAVSGIVRENGIGVVVSRDEVKELHTVLSGVKSEYNTYIDNIHRFRERYNMDSMIDQVLVHNGGSGSGVWMTGPSDSSSCEPFTTGRQNGN